MSSKINVTDILSDHYATLRNESTAKISILDLFVFLGAPFSLGIILFIKRFEISDAAVTTIITAMSIFAGLLINVLVLIYTVSQGVDQLTATRGKEDVEAEKRFLREIFANISYAVLISIVSVIALVMVDWADAFAKRLLSAVIAVLVAHFVLTLMMAIKRIHILLTGRFSAGD